MKKTALVLLCVFLSGFLFCGPVFSESFYSPMSPITITNPGRHLTDLGNGELPEILKKWAKRYEKPEGQVKFKDSLTRSIDILNWGMSYYKGDTFFSNDAISFVVNVPTRNWKFSMTFSEYKWENNKINYYHDGQVKQISSDEFEKLKYAFAQAICESSEYLVGFVGDLRGKVIENLKKRLVDYGVLSKKDDFEKKMAQVPKFKYEDGAEKFNISADERMFIPPKFVFSDFCPEEVVITPISADGSGGIILGLTYPDTGNVVYHPITLVYGYLKLFDTFTHELIHRNKYLQGLLMSQQFDVEIWASSSERFSGGFNFLFHPYRKISREIGTVITSFDADRARREIIKFDRGGSLDINNALANDYGKDAGDISDSFRNTMYEKFAGAFYSDPIFWSCVNDDLYDSDGAYKVFFYTRYAFSLLGGQKKTAEWLDRHEEVILQAYKKAKEAIESKKAEDRKEGKPKERSRAIRTFLEKNKGLLNLYSKLLKLPELTSDEWKVERIEKMMELGVIGIPQIAYPISTGGMTNEEIY